MGEVRNPIVHKNPWENFSTSISYMNLVGNPWNFDGNSWDLMKIHGNPAGYFIEIHMDL